MYLTDSSSPASSWCEEALDELFPFEELKVENVKQDSPESLFDLDWILPLEMDVLPQKLNRDTVEKKEAEVKIAAKRRKEAILRRNQRRRNQLHKIKVCTSPPVAERDLLRKVKNRESAALSRKRNRDKMKELEQIVANLQKRNAFLEKKVAYLEQGHSSESEVLDVVKNNRSRTPFHKCRTIDIGILLITIYKLRCWRISCLKIHNAFILKISMFLMLKRHDVSRSNLISFSSSDVFGIGLCHFGLGFLNSWRKQNSFQWSDLDVRYL